MALHRRLEVLAPWQWQIYRDIRLQALQESPDAFGSTYAIELAIAPEVWESRLAAAATSNADLPLIAFVDGNPAGLAWAHRDASDPELVHLFQMWVAPTYRRLGIGRELVERAISWARGLPATTLQLKVSVANASAYRLYLGSGFRKFGEPEPLREGSALVTHTMRLDLNR